MALKASIQQKLTKLAARRTELGVLLSQSEVTQDRKRFLELSKEYAQLEEVVSLFEQHQAAQRSLEDTQALCDGSDAEMQALAQTELPILKEQLQTLASQIELALLPTDPHDDCNVFLEIRAGTGGDEAAIFAGDLFRMYSRYAEDQKWRVEITSVSEGEHGGYKEIISRIVGEQAYAQLKFESGAHRVQRVPATESQGRIHTSACTVAVLPEIESSESIDINPSDLRIDTFRSSGAGGQHVNTTDSAVRITHIPTGTVVECQDERSQHKNRARAMSLLQARIIAEEKAKQQREEAQTRRNLVGSGDRSERIRTYNFPQGRLTDHRIGLTLYQLEQIIEGDLGEVIAALRREHQIDLMAAAHDAST